MCSSEHIKLNADTNITEYVFIEKEDYEKMKLFLAKCNYPMPVVGYFYGDLSVVKRGKKPKKFDADQVKEIQKKLAEGMSIRKASIEFQCAKETIQKIKNNKY